MTANEPESEVAVVSCPCGASVEADLGGRRPVVVCPECKESLKIVVTLDPRTGKKRVGILVSPMAVVPEKPKKAQKGAPAAAEGMFKPLCTCGSEVIVDFRSVDSVFTCGWCGASFTAFLKTDKETGEKAPVLIPVQVMPVSKDRPKSTRKLPKVAEPPKAKTARKVSAPPLEDLEELEAPSEAQKKTARREAAAPEPPAEEPEAPKPKTLRRSPEEKKAELSKSRVGLKPPPPSVPSKESLFLTARGEIGAQEAVVGEEGARIYCFCGKEIMLVGDAANRLLRCVECGLSFRVFLAVEPRTKKPMAVTLPRGPASAKK
jgi:hypothetical protein